MASPARRVRRNASSTAVNAIQDLAVGTGLIEKHRQCIQHRTAQSLQGIQKGKFKGHG